MTRIYVGSSSAHVEETILKEFIEKLPVELHTRYHSFKFLNDANLFLLGKRLLSYALETTEYHYLTLDQLCLGSGKRPCFQAPIDFNISHSGDRVVCAVSNNSRVGIDIEEMKAVDFEDYRRCWSVDEARVIGSGGIGVFFDLWTRKEAVLKAAGTGLLDDLSSLDVLKPVVEFSDSYWYIHPIYIAPGYKANIAVSRYDETILSPIEVSF